MNIDNSPIQSFSISGLSIWWKILIILNIVLDIPVLIYVLTGYSWNCKLNQFPNWGLPILLGISTLIMVGAAYLPLTPSVDNNHNFFDFITNRQEVGDSIRFYLFVLFFALFPFVICCSSIAILLTSINESGSWIISSALSPDTLRIAEVCGENCGEGCQSSYSLRVSYQALPFADLFITEFKEGYGSYDVHYIAPQTKWVNNNSISTIETGNVTKIYHISLVNFNWRYLLLFFFYIGVKYNFVIIKLRKQH